MRAQILIAATNGEPAGGGRRPPTGESRVWYGEGRLEGARPDLALSSANAIHNSMIKEGDPAPDFDLETDEGTRVSLASLKGRNVVLFFYPKDNTSG